MLEALNIYIYTYANNSRTGRLAKPLGMLFFFFFQPKDFQEFRSQISFSGKVRREKSAPLFSASPGKHLLAQGLVSAFLTKYIGTSQLPSASEVNGKYLHITSTPPCAQGEQIALDFSQTAVHSQTSLASQLVHLGKL